MKIIQWSRRDKDKADLDLELWAREEYVELPTKTSDGQVTNVYYDPQRATGILSVWPETDKETDYLVLYVQRTLEDLDDEADEVDFPQEWYFPIMWNLAQNIIPKFGADRARREEIRQNATDTLDEAWASDTEDYMWITPETRFLR